MAKRAESHHWQTVNREEQSIYNCPVAPAFLCHIFKHELSSSGRRIRKGRVRSLEGQFPQTLYVAPRVTAVEMLPRKEEANPVAIQSRTEIQRQDLVITQLGVIVLKAP